jgi:VIT1/CCC1 family predicted Fe2+/Mn2+ transporter
MNKHWEYHRSDRIGWLRAAVLGANDGIISTSSLIIGISAGGTSRHQIYLSGLAAMVAGAASMAAGEYVSVSSQADLEKADLAKEKIELETDPDHELEELTQIYIGRGLKKDLALEVATQLMRHDMLGAHARDELGIFSHLQARPFQAAIASALAFSTGALLPVFIVTFLPETYPLQVVVPIVSIMALLGMGLWSSHAGGAKLWKGSLRIVTWGAMAMVLSYFVGNFFGVTVS